MSAVGAGERPAGLVERAMVWVLCRFLPDGFRGRQRGEWTGDLLAMADAGAARWRYLLAAAWTLPALRAHARSVGADASTPALRPGLRVTTLARALLLGLGAPVLSWLIAVPVRYYLLDVPGRLANKYGDVPVDPKELWPTDGALVVLTPLWIALTLLTLVVWIGPLLLCAIGMAIAAVGPIQRGASHRYRLTAGLVGLAVVVLAAVVAVVALALVADYVADLGVVAALLGCLAIGLALRARGLILPTRLALVLIGCLAIAVYVTHQTAAGEAMLVWFMD